MYCKIVALINVSGLFLSNHATLGGEAAMKILYET